MDIRLDRFTTSIYERNKTEKNLSKNEKDINKKVIFEQPCLLDIPMIHSLIYKCFDKLVSEFYDEKVVSGLKSLYTKEKIEEIMDDPEYEVWVANFRNEPRWVMALRDSIADNGIELKMCYGICPYSFDKSLRFANNEVIRKGKDYLQGVVLKSAWKTIARYGSEGYLKMGEEFTRTETNLDTREDFYLRVRSFKFKPMEVLLFENSFEAC